MGEKRWAHNKHPKLPLVSLFSFYLHLLTPTLAVTMRHYSVSLKMWLQHVVAVRTVWYTTIFVQVKLGFPKSQVGRWSRVVRKHELSMPSCVVLFRPAIPVVHQQTSSEWPAPQCLRRFVERIFHKSCAITSIHWRRTWGTNRHSHSTSWWSPTTMASRQDSLWVS